MDETQPEPTLPATMRIHHVLPEQDIIEHIEHMDCLCTPFVEQVVQTGDGSVVVVQHRTFESTKPVRNVWPFGGASPWFGWPGSSE